MSSLSSSYCGCGFGPGHLKSGRVPPHCPNCHCLLAGHKERWQNQSCVGCTSAISCGHPWKHEQIRGKKKRSNSGYLSALAKAQRLVGYSVPDISLPTNEEWSNTVLTTASVFHPISPVSVKNHNSIERPATNAPREELRDRIERLIKEESTVNIGILTIPLPTCNNLDTNYQSLVLDQFDRENNDLSREYLNKLESLKEERTQKTNALQLKFLEEVKTIVTEVRKITIGDMIRNLSVMISTVTPPPSSIPT